MGQVWGLWALLQVCFVIQEVKIGSWWGRPEGRVSEDEVSVADEGSICIAKHKVAWTWVGGF